MTFTDLLQSIIEHLRGESGAARMSLPDVILDVEVLGAGRGRLVIADPHDAAYVLKLPLSFAGHYMNACEARLFAQCDEWLGAGRLASCEMVLIDGLDCLRMERVRKLSREEVAALGETRWIDFVDGEQVGLSLTGKVVAFDFGG